MVCNADWDTVGFDLADIKVVPTRDEEQLVGHLGPDPLGEHWDPAEATRRLGADERAVHVALLDQRNVAGFGNEYANEILFVRGILPTRHATETDAAAIVDLGARMLRANRDRNGRTFTGDARPGRSTWVYGRDAADPAAAAEPSSERVRSAQIRLGSAIRSGARPARPDADVACSKRRGNLPSDNLSGTP